MEPRSRPGPANDVLCLKTSVTVVHYKVDGRRAFEQVLVVTDDDKITVTDLQDEILIEHTRPAPGVGYVGNGRRRGPKTTEVSPMS
jgi:putative transposase